MADYRIIENGPPRIIATADGLTSWPEGNGSAEDLAFAAWVADGNSPDEVDAHLSIEALAGQRKSAIAAARWAYVQAGTVTVASATIRTDDGSRAEIEALHGVLRDEIIASVKFKPVNGPPVEVNLAAVAAIRSAVTLFYQAAREHEADLIDAIAAAVTAADRAAVQAVTWSAPA